MPSVREVTTDCSLPAELAHVANVHGPRPSIAGDEVFSQPGPLVGRILVVDDFTANCNLIARVLAQDRHVVFTAGDGAEALELVAQCRPDLVLMDVMMPRLDGFEACRRLKRQPSTRLIPVVLITALQDSRDRIRGIEVGADDFLTKPFNPHELQARVRSLLRIKRYTDDLESAESVILSLAQIIEARDAYTEGHCRRLATYATALGRAIGLGEDDIIALEMGGFLHDIGKVGIPDAVLLKPGRLTAAEYQIVQQHTLVGDYLCDRLHSLKRVRPIVRHHHEHLDGSGYPDGLHGDGIPLLAQIMGIVDVFDAATTNRPYKPAASVEQACEELAGEVEHRWRRADLVQAFIALVRHNRLACFDASAGATDHDHDGPGAACRGWLVSQARDSVTKSPGPAPGSQGAMTEHIGNSAREEQRGEAGCPARTMSANL
jgi:putative two-component system response regulator